MRRQAAVVVMSALTLLAALALPAAALAASSPPPPDAPAAQPEGRRVERSDWIDRVPLAAGMTLIVIAVDAVFILKILHNRQTKRERRAAAQHPPPVNGSGPRGPGRPSQ